MPDHASPSQPLHIVVADDHPVVRQSARFLLEAAPRPWRVHEADSGQEALRLLRQPQFGLAILDLAMPGLNGFELIVCVRACRPDVPVVVLTMCAEEQVALRALRAGVQAYVTKDSAGRELVPAVDRVVAGGSFLSAALAERVPLWQQAVGSRPPLSS